MMEVCSERTQGGKWEQNDTSDSTIRFLNIPFTKCTRQRPVVLQVKF